MSDTGVFGRLASTLSMDDRRNLLEKLNAQSGGVQVLYDEADGGEAEAGDSAKKYGALPWFYRLFYWLVGLFRGKTPLQVFQDRQVSQLGRLIAAQSPGIYDYEQGLLLPAFYQAATGLKESARFFYDALDMSVNRDRGAFYAFLASLEMEDIHRMLLEETDPQKIAEQHDGVAESALRQLGFQAMDGCIAAIGDDRRAVMYYNARTLNCLKELASFLFDRLLVSFSTQNALVVMNDTKVIPARIVGMARNRAFEATLHKDEGDGRWLAFVKDSRKLAVGDTLGFSGKLRAEVIAKRGSSGVELLFDAKTPGIFKVLNEIGSMPLPPYVRRPADASDRESYQTVYARSEGAVAAPTAGLHMTKNLLARMEKRGIELAFLTLHVGAGTFLPVKANDTDGHEMHSEYGVVQPETAKRITAAKRAGRPIVAIGTTTLRLLESAADEKGNVRAYDGETDIFITPGYRFKTADFLLTNFHLPRSTLFMLVCAFAGMEGMGRAYARAKSSGYRFYSYGDASLLERGK